MEAISDFITTLSVVAAFVFGILAFLLGGRFIFQGMTVYRSKFVESMGQDLRLSFVNADPMTLFGVTIVATLTLAISGFIAVGPVGGVFCILIGVLSPKFLLSFMKKRRIDKFLYQFPDALMTLAAALRAGASLSKGLEQLALRQPAPLSQEFSLVVAEHRVGRDLSEALEELCVRIPRQELELFAAAVGISRGVGGNLADTLDSLAKTLSEKMHIEGKISALTASGRSQGWVVSLLPIAVGAVLFKQQPKEMSLLFTEVYGWAVLAVVSVMMALAVFMIRKIVNIDV